MENEKRPAALATIIRDTIYRHPFRNRSVPLSVGLSFSNSTSTRFSMCVTLGQTSSGASLENTVSYDEVDRMNFDRRLAALCGSFRTRAINPEAAYSGLTMTLGDWPRLR